MNISHLQKDVERFGGFKTQLAKHLRECDAIDLRLCIYVMYVFGMMAKVFGGYLYNKDQDNFLNFLCIYMFLLQKRASDAL